jgi:hypothetical protein
MLLEQIFLYVTEQPCTFLYMLLEQIFLLAGWDSICYRKVYIFVCLCELLQVISK